MKKKEQERILIRETGKAMRFFLNTSLILIILFAAIILLLPDMATLQNLIVALFAVLVSICFFLVFLRHLKKIEAHAAEEKNILLTSKVIWEYNKSWVIRTLTGGIKAFIEDKNEK